MRKAIPFSLLVVLLGLLVFQVGCGGDDEDPVKPTPKCKYTMTYPTAGLELATDEVINIRWERATTESVRIQLYKGANAVGTIKSDYSNTGTDGFYPWSNPETFAWGTGDDYSIRVSSMDDLDCFDQTGQFKITDTSNCSLQFAWTGQDSIPDLVRDQELDIRWNSESTTGWVKIELWYYPFSSAQELVGVIAERVADTGSYLWSARSFNRGTDEGYRLKIMDYDYSDCSNISDTFNITDENVCTIDVLGIGDGQIFDPGDSIPISFNPENSSGVVKLKLYSGNLPVNAPPRYGIIEESFDTVNGTEIYVWEVTTLDHPGPAFNAFNIRAFDVDDEYCFGKSSTFTITQ